MDEPFANQPKITFSFAVEYYKMFNPASNRMKLSSVWGLHRLSLCVSPCNLPAAEGYGRWRGASGLSADLGLRLIMSRGIK